MVRGEYIYIEKVTKTRYTRYTSKYVKMTYTLKSAPSGHQIEFSSTSEATTPTSPKDAYRHAQQGADIISPSCNGSDFPSFIRETGICPGVSCFMILILFHKYYCLRFPH